ncbi:MAG: hypothetical protein NZ552_05120 [Planctomycetes bacterium]|nr:hypothetical protein [Planctomycetota bacterium]
MTRARHSPFDPALPLAQLLAGLPAGARQLIAAVQCLYGGDWDACIEDCRRRAAGRPYLFRLEVPGIDVLAVAQGFKAYFVARGESPALTTGQEERS